MKRFLAAIMLTAVALCGCAEQPPGEELPVDRTLSYSADVFFCSEDELLIPVDVTLSYTQDMAAAVMGYLVEDGAAVAALSEAGLTGVLPADAQFSVSVDNRNAQVEITSGQIGQMSERRCQKAVASVVNTLTGLPGIDTVSITVNGEARMGSRELSDNMDSSVMNVDGASTAEKQIPVSLWFKTPEDGWLVPVTRYMSDDSPQAVAAQLLAGPINTEKFMSLFPKGTRLLGAELEKGVLTLDFSKEFSQIEQEKEQKLLRGIELTFGSLENVSDVVIKVEGSEYAPGKTTMSGSINELVW